jgi:hypothetical protein
MIKKQLTETLFHNDETGWNHEQRQLSIPNGLQGLVIKWRIGPVSENQGRGLGPAGKQSVLIKDI